MHAFHAAQGSNIKYKSSYNLVWSREKISL
jgi:hypothetical protein